MIPLDQRTLQDAAKLTVESGVSYDCVHTACMHNKELDTIITEDAADWKKIKKFKIIRPLEYKKRLK